MSENDRPKSLQFAGVQLDQSRHICAFFNSAEEEYRVLWPFIEEGLERGEKAFHIVGPGLRADYLGRIKMACDLAAREQSGQFECRNWEDAYLRGGHFDQNAMLALIEEVLTTSREQGFPLTRLVAHMEWSREDRPGVDDLVEYEARLNYILPRYADPVICTYDIAKYSGDVIMDVMRTHPVVIVGGMLRTNPFFVPPDEFLQELRERAPAARPS